MSYSKIMVSEKQVNFASNVMTTSPDFSWSNKLTSNIQIIREFFSIRAKFLCVKLKAQKLQDNSQTSSPLSITKRSTAAAG